MKDGISNNISSRDIITKKLHWATRNKPKLDQDITNLESLNDGASNGTILSFSGGLRDGGLRLGEPRDKIMTSENSITYSRTRTVWAASPIGIIIC